MEHSASMFVEQAGQAFPSNRDANVRSLLIPRLFYCHVDIGQSPPSRWFPDWPQMSILEGSVATTITETEWFANLGLLRLSQTQ